MKTNKGILKDYKYFSFSENTTIDEMLFLGVKCRLAHLFIE